MYCERAYATLNATLNATLVDATLKLDAPLAERRYCEQGLTSRLVRCGRVIYHSRALSEVYLRLCR